MSNLGALEINYEEQQQQQHPFNGPLSGTNQVSQYQNGKTNLDLLEQAIVSGSISAGPYLHLATDR